MNNFLYINYPSWIHPELFPGVPVLGLIRWYGLMYIFAFATAFLVLKKQFKNGELDTPEKKTTEDDVFSFIAWGIVGLILGARIFSTLVYDTSGLYWKKPWLIFWPFDPKTKQFTGLAGMSYHGGFIGGLIAMLIWCRVHKKPIWKWIDAMGVAIPLGFTFGRIGNFMNGELYGRITTMPWGMIFPNSEMYSSSLDWVQEIMMKIGMDVSGADPLVYLPRHPSQLYEALFEGVVLWVILWNLRKKKPFDGFIASCYTIGYGLFRFVIEYFREPDKDLGFRIAGGSNTQIALNTSLLNISTGQIFCFCMIVLGIIMMIATWRYSKRKKV
ncbi:MAG: prolipoprotein diacylglyceryl transferase [Treponema sp.]|nr:prolipoprotein diacylglyceryl transferase [Treponema sp.]